MIKNMMNPTIENEPVKMPAMPQFLAVREALRAPAWLPRDHSDSTYNNNYYRAT